MKVIYYSDDTITPANNIKHVINFFGIMGCMKVYVLNKHASTEQKCELVQHYFDYPYFSSIVNPELFQKELNDEEKKLIGEWYHYGYFLLHCSLLLLYRYTWHTKIKNQKGTYRVSFCVSSAINFGYCVLYCRLLMDAF